jgi:predicted amidohydrolase YtcJ
MHAIGERAIDVYLDAIERVGADPLRFRHRIDHFGVPTDAAIARAAHLGVMVPTQPAFPFLRGGPGSIYERRLGPERDRRAYPLRSLVHAGVIVGGGSDCPVVPGEPLLGLHSCVNHPYPEQRLQPLEALRLYTVNNAYLAFEEHLRGTIEVGRSADFVCLDHSPLDVAPDRIRDLNVLLTVSRGVAVYDSGQLHNQEEVT